MQFSASSPIASPRGSRWTFPTKHPRPVSEIPRTVYLCYVCMYIYIWTQTLLCIGTSRTVFFRGQTVRPESPTMDSPIRVTEKRLKQWRACPSAYSDPYYVARYAGGHSGGNDLSIPEGSSSVREYPFLTIFIVYRSFSPGWPRMFIGISKFL